MSDLGTLGGATSQAVAMNSTGVVAGSADTATPGESHAFVWSASQGMRDLGTLGGSRSSVNGVNDLGQVVGSAETADGHAHAFLGRKGRIHR